MKKFIIALVCSVAVLFSACKPDPIVEPEPEPIPTNEKFLGNYSGFLEVNGEATAPELGEETSMPIDSLRFEVTALMNPGTTEFDIIALFTINGESMEVTGTCNENKIDFGDLTYHYVENISTFDVILTLSGELEGDKLTLHGPISGEGLVELEGFPVQLNLNVDGDVNGEMVKTEEIN